MTRALTFRLVAPDEAERPQCGAQSSKRSTARCEMPLNHEAVTVAAGFHCGRTRRGYWKSWPVEVSP